MTIKFDKFQKAVIKWRKGTAVVAAAAGSGKSSVLIERTASLLEEGVFPNAIITLVYNAAAAESFRNRLADRVGPKLADACEARTFHSYCYGVLREWAPGERSLQGNRLIGAGGPNGCRLALDAMKQSGLKGDWKVYLAAADQIRDSLIDVTQTGALQQVAKLPICGGGLGMAQQLIRFAVRYQQVKEEGECMDFADMLYTVCVAIRDKFPCAASMQSYEHVQVDEAQDFSPSRLQVAQWLAAGADSFVMALDLRQSIYKFSGAAPELVRKTVIDKPETKLLTMPVNRRSTRAIVDVGNALCEGQEWNLGGACEADPKNGEGAPPRVLKTFSAVEEAETIAEEIEVALKGGETLSDENGKARFALLVRVNAQAAILEAALNTRGIPVRVIGHKGGIWGTTQGREVLAYLRASEGQADEDLALVANKPKRYLKRAIVERAIEQVDDEKDVLHILWNSGVAPAIALANDIQKLASYTWDARCNALRALLTRDTDEMEDAAESPDDDKLAVYGALCDTATLLGSMAAVDEEIASLKKLKSDSPAVEISTCHRAKGDQWEHVYVCGCRPGLFPHQKSDDLEEEKRIFYVSITRARKTLTVSLADRRPSEFLMKAGLLGAADAVVDLTNSVKIRRKA